MTNINALFDLVNDLYYKDTGYMRPGKDDPFFNTSCSENIARFEKWSKDRLLDCALSSLMKNKLLLDRIERELNCVSHSDSDFFPAEAERAISNIERMLDR